MLAALAFAGCLSNGRVELSHSAGRWSLLVDGKPFVARGVGGDASKQVAATLGANCFRTWGAENLDVKLDEARALGMKVVVGIWLGHKEHGFKYDDPVQVKKQADETLKVVAQYRDDPAVLMWSLGNEMEGFGEGDDPNVWTAVEDLAHAVKKADPHHPVMTVIAEVGGKKVPSLHALCPSVDIVGINSYAGAASIYDRYTKAGGTKPYMLTEFGPPGGWESGSTPWSRPVELTSTEKAAWYERAYKGNVGDHPELCLGSFAFAWGNKFEATATWFGMFLPDGTKLGPVDVMERAWSGKPPVHPCPEIKRFAFKGEATVEPGDTLAVKLEASDPGGDKPSVTYALTSDSGVVGVSGDKEDVPDAIPGAVTPTMTGAAVKVPTAPGPYRLYVVARNKHGGAATGSIAFRVRGVPPVALGARVKLPLALYTDDGASLPYVPSGWMGDVGSMTLDLGSRSMPHSGRTCVKWAFTEPGGWGAVAWQSPDGDWGDKPGGFDLTGARRLAFWARGETGGETVSFGIGIIKKDKRYFDTAVIDGGKVVLKPTWDRYAVELKGRDLTRIKTGFVMTLAGQGRPATVYLDNIVVE